MFERLRQCVRAGQSENSVAIGEELVARGVPDLTAHLAAELGVLAFKLDYAQWSEADRDDTTELAHFALAALEQLRAATTTLG